MNTGTSLNPMKHIGFKEKKSLEEHISLNSKHFFCPFTGVLLDTTGDY
jgi:hypothetical protein